MVGIGSCHSIVGLVVLVSLLLAAISSETWSSSLEAQRLDELAYLYAQTEQEDDTRALERSIEQMRSEVQRLTNRFDLTLYQSWRSNTKKVRTSPSVFGEGVIPSQGGLELAYQPPVVGFRDERVFQIFGRLLWSTEPRSLNVDEDSLQG